jgi:hypothetical protein
MWWKMYVGLHVKYQLFLSGFNEPLIFSTYFREKKSASNKFNENTLCRSDLFHEDWRTDMTKLIVAFRNLANSLNTRDNMCMIGYMLQRYGRIKNVIDFPGHQMINAKFGDQNYN